MGRESRRIEVSDLMSVESYMGLRSELRRRAIVSRRLRRVEVGPWLTLYFENYDTMWRQVHEMMVIERTALADIGDELEAYNPLIPQGSELAATLMAEIPNAEERAAALRKMVGVAEAMYIEIDGVRVWSAPEPGPRSAEGARDRASSVYFVHFPFTEDGIAAFRRGGSRVVMGVEHASGSHETMITEETRAALAEDFAEA